MGGKLSSPDFDLRVRMAAFDWLAGQVDIHGDVLPRRPLLEGGFLFMGQHIHLISQQGIARNQADFARHIRKPA